MRDKNATKANPSSAIKDTIKPTRHPYKLELCLELLLAKGEVGVIELEALNAYGETSLHSTISTLYNGKGISFNRVVEPHINQRGGKTKFTRYSIIEPDAIAKAKTLLTHYRNKRGLAA